MEKETFKGLQYTGTKQFTQHRSLALKLLHVSVVTSSLKTPTRRKATS